MQRFRWPPCCHFIYIIIIVSAWHREGGIHMPCGMHVALRTTLWSRSSPSTVACALGTGLMSSGLCGLAFFPAGLLPHSRPQSWSNVAFYHPCASCLICGADVIRLPRTAFWGLRKTPYAQFSLPPVTEGRCIGNVFWIQVQKDTELQISRTWFVSPPFPTVLDVFSGVCQEELVPHCLHQIHITQVTNVPCVLILQPLGEFKSKGEW